MLIESDLKKKTVPLPVMIEQLIINQPILLPTKPIKWYGNIEITAGQRHWKSTKAFRILVSKTFSAAFQTM